MSREPGPLKWLRMATRKSNGITVRVCLYCEMRIFGLTPWTAAGPSKKSQSITHRIFNAFVMASFAEPCAERRYRLAREIPNQFRASPSNIWIAGHVNTIRKWHFGVVLCGAGNCRECVPQRLWTSYWFRSGPGAVGYDRLRRGRCRS